MESEEGGVKRFVNFSPEEEQIVIALVEKYKNVIECKKSGALTWKQKEATWKKIQCEFNSQNNCFRSVKNLKDKYQNLKKKTKQKFSLNVQSMRRTGGGPDETIPVSDVESALKAILDEQITGLSNSFDNDADMKDATIMIVPPPPPVSQENIENSPDVLVNNESAPMFTEGPAEIVVEEMIDSWEAYSSSSLKKPPTKKLQTNVRYKHKMDKCYTSISQKLMEEKLAFIRLQKEKFLEEHELRMTLLKKQIVNEDLTNKKRCERN